MLASSPYKNHKCKYFKFSTGRHLWLSEAHLKFQTLDLPVWLRIRLIKIILNLPEGRSFDFEGFQWKAAERKGEKFILRIEMSLQYKTLDIYTCREEELTSNEMHLKLIQGKCYKFLMHICNKKTKTKTWQRQRQRRKDEKHESNPMKNVIRSTCAYLQLHFLPKFNQLYPWQGW